MITPTSLLNPDAFLSPLAIDEAVHRALDEDLGRAGDITSLATIPEATIAQAVLVAQRGNLCHGLNDAGKHGKVFPISGLRGERAARGQKGHFACIPRNPAGVQAKDGRSSQKPLTRLEGLRSARTQAQSGQASICTLMPANTP